MELQFYRIFSPFCQSNHERDGHDGNGDTHYDVRGERFAEHECADHDGGDGLEHPEDGSLGGPDVTRGDGQSGRRNHRRQEGKSYQVEPVVCVVEACGESGIGNQNLSQKHNCSHGEGIEGEQRVGDAGDGLAPVDDDDKEGVDQGRTDGKEYTDGVERLCAVALRHDEDAPEGCRDGQPHRPGRHHFQEHHDDGHQHRVEEHQRRGQSGSDVFVGIEQEEAARCVEQSEDEQDTRLLSGNPETLPADQQKQGQNQYGKEIAEEEDGFGGGTVLHQGNRKQGVQSIRDAGDDSRRIADEGVLAKFFHVFAEVNVCRGAKLVIKWKRGLPRGHDFVRRGRNYFR